MPIRIDALTGVPESRFLQLIKDYREIDNADIVTAFRDDNGTFTVESTIFDRTPGGAGSTTLTGKMSTFGGPDDQGVGPDEGLALFNSVGEAPDIFLPTQPPGTTGLARRLNPQIGYLACRWDYNVTPKSFLRTALVKVTNPANNKSEQVRPVDWGPNAATGRVADLSPGLAARLGLVTDKDCVVEIPLPAGAHLPPADAGIATGVNLAAIDATIFPADLTRRLIVMTTANNATYWITNQIGPEEGGQSLVRHVGGNTEIVLSDATVFPVKPSASIPAVVADELNKAIAKTQSESNGPGGGPPASDDEASAKLLAAAQAFVGTSTATVPNTDGGNLACAWAINEVARRACGRPISVLRGGTNGLSTIGLFEALQRHTPVALADHARPGAIIIAPTQGSRHGHVGIVGPKAGNTNSTPVFSNSSTKRQFAQNYTIGSFTNRFQAKGLNVLFFALKKDRF